MSHFAWFGPLVCSPDGSFASVERVVQPTLRSATDL